MLLTARTALFIAKSLGAKEKGYSGEERMRHICRQIVGDNLKGEMALFSFPLPSGGEELRGAPLVYIPDLCTFSKRIKC